MYNTRAIQILQEAKIGQLKCYFKLYVCVSVEKGKGGTIPRPCMIFNVSSKSNYTLMPGKVFVK